MKRQLLLLLSIALLCTGLNLLVGCDNRPYYGQASAPPPQPQAPISQPADQEYFRTLVQDFLTERHPELSCQGMNFLPVTDNLWVVGAQVFDRNVQRAYRKDFKLERFADAQGQTMWQVDYGTDSTLREAAYRQGMADQLAQLNQASYFENILMWHYICGRPAPIWYGYPGCSYSGYGYAYYGFTPLPVYRTRYVTVINNSTTIINHRPAAITMAPATGRAYVGTKSSGYVKSDMGTLKSGANSSNLRGFRMQSQASPTSRPAQTPSTGYRGSQAGQNGGQSGFRMAPSSPAPSRPSTSGFRMSSPSTGGRRR